MHSSILPFLNHSSRDWDDLELDVPCPIHFTAEEIRQHREDGKGWNELQDFWQAAEGIITRDGWTHNDTYDRAVGLFVELQKMGLERWTGKDREEFEAQMKWIDKVLASSTENEAGN